MIDTKVNYKNDLAMKMLLVSFLTFSPTILAAPMYYFSDTLVELYLMLIIPTIMIIAWLFYKVGVYVNLKSTTRFKNEKVEAYRLVKSYCARLESLNKQYEYEKKKVAHATQTIKSANLRIACLSAGLNNQSQRRCFDFFADLQTLEQTKKRYKLLCAAFHPDKGGSQETMRLINDQYRQASGCRNVS